MSKAIAISIVLVTSMMACSSPTVDHGVNATGASIAGNDLAQCFTNVMSLRKQAAPAVAKVGVAGAAIVHYRIALLFSNCANIAKKHHNSEAYYAIQDWRAISLVGATREMSAPVLDSPSISALLHLQAEDFGREADKVLRELINSGRGSASDKVTWKTLRAEVHLLLST